MTRRERPGTRPDDQPDEHPRVTAPKPTEPDGDHESTNTTAGTRALLMTDYSPRKGWIFELVGGPHAGRTYRLPWTTSSDPIQAYAELPQRLSFADAEYTQRPAMQGGRRILAQAGPGVNLPAVAYVYVGDVAGSDAACRGVDADDSGCPQ
jgi:hypothetical protein